MSSRDSNASAGILILALTFELTAPHDGFPPARAAHLETSAAGPQITKSVIYVHCTSAAPAKD